MHVHLIVPELFWPHAAPPERLPDLTAIETLLARGRKKITACASHDAWWLRQFAVPDQPNQSPGAAPYMALGDGLQPGDAAWLCADPVHLRVEGDDLALSDSYRFAIDRDEADALLASVNAQFTVDGLMFRAPHPARWYVSLAHAPAAQMTAVEDARGQRIDARLPRGAEGLRWQAVMNEIQMLFHVHPVNVAREERGEPVISGVWFSNGGVLQPVEPPRVQCVLADRALARGLARAANIAEQPLPESAAALDGIARQGGIVWALIDSLRAPAAYTDFPAWLEQLQRLDRAWFGPLLARLRARTLGMVTIHALGRGSELTAEATAGDLRFLWRRRKPLEAYVNRSAPAAG